MDIARLDEIEWPEHRSGIQIRHNNHLGYYDPLEATINRLSCRDAVISAAGELDLFRTTGSVWEVLWERTDGVHMHAVGSTLGAALQAMDVDGKGLAETKWPSHKASLHLTVDEHLGMECSVYDPVTKTSEPREVTVASLVEDGDYDPESFPDAEDLAKSVATGRCWTLQWYPLTPIGSHVVRAATLSKLVATAVTENLAA